MGIRDMFRRGQDGPALYRRAWTESNDPVVAEARAQTLAIQRLEVWLRLVYSALAFAVLLGYTGATPKAEAECPSWRALCWG